MLLGVLPWLAILSFLSMLCLSSVWRAGGVGCGRLDTPRGQTCSLPRGASGFVDVEADFHVLAAWHGDVAVATGDLDRFAAAAQTVLLGQIDLDDQFVALYTSLHVRCHTSYLLVGWCVLVLSQCFTPGCNTGSSRRFDTLSTCS